MSESQKCSPRAFETFKRSGRCVSNADVKAVARRWNEAHPDRRINEAAEIDIVLEKLHAVIGRNHHDWSDHQVVKRDSKLRSKMASRFRPKMPQSWRNNPSMWLSTRDIEKVMRQYQEGFANFRFLGVYPRDFTTVRHGRCLAGREICSNEFIYSGIDHAGLVFNMDRHDQAGSHWVACFVSLDESKPLYGVYYYDSIARPPPPEIATWILRVQEDVLNSKPKKRRFEVAYNRERRQFANTECGMFAMVFLSVAMKNEETFRQICNAMGTDRDMNILRNVMYR